MTLPIELLLALSLIGQQVAENLFSPFVSGQWMRIVALAVCVGLTFGAQTLGLKGLEGFSPLQVAVLGIAAGLGSNVIHGLLARFAPGSNVAPLAGILTKLANHTPPPAVPPATNK